MSLKALIRKEVKELLFESTIIIGVILMPLIIFPVMGYAMSLGFGAAAEETAQAKVLYVDLDEGRYAQRLMELLAQSGMNVVKLTVGEDGLEPLELIKSHEAQSLMLVPKGFTQAIMVGVRPSVQLYAKVEAPSVSRMRTLSTIAKAIEAAGAALGKEIAKERGLDYDVYASPFRISPTLVIRGEPVQAGPELLAQLYLNVMTAVPMVVFLVAFTAGTVAATSVGLEKEAKTLEILLTLPVSRMAILASKVFGSILIALLGVASFMLGFSFYWSALTRSMEERVPVASVPANIAELIGLTPLSIALMGATLLLALLITLGLGLLAGVLAGDVRGAQQLVPLFIGPPLFLPYFLLLFAGLEALPNAVRLGLLINPFTHMFLATTAALRGDIVAVMLSFGAMAIAASLALGLAAWLFSGDRLITMKIRLRKAT